VEGENGVCQAGIFPGLSPVGLSSHWWKGCRGGVCARKVLSFSKDLAWLEKHLWLSLAYYHFVLAHDSLSQRLSEPQPTRGSGSLKRWQPITPAMAAGITDHVWTMEELLSYRVPPDFRDQLDQQATNATS